MEGHGRHHRLPQQFQHQQSQYQPQQQQQYQSANVDGSDRFPQWSNQETKEFLRVRAELDQTFMETKRNKLLWEVTATKMKEKGYNRSAEQCKCKWKNLVTRYKGCETMEPETVRQQFPFYSDLQAIFAARMQRMLWAEAEGGGPSGSKKKAEAEAEVEAAPLSSDEEDENGDSEGEKDSGVGRRRRKKKGKRTHNAVGSHNLKELLQEFLNQQLQMEAKWMEAFEAREVDRRMKEMEWRQAMEALEKERLLMTQRWREREEQRKMREEARAEKRDALITALLNKMTRQNM